MDMADSLARAVILFSLRPDGLESDVTTLDASARRMHAAVCGARARMPPRNIRKKRRDSDDEERDGVEDDESTAEALERARAAQGNEFFHGGEFGVKNRVFFLSVFFYYETCMESCFLQ